MIDESLLGHLAVQLWESECAAQELHVNSYIPTGCVVVQDISGFCLISGAHLKQSATQN